MAKVKTALKAPEKEIERLRKTGRNDTCPCGSNKKYKKCHLHEDEETERAYLSAVNEANQKAAEAEAKEHDPNCNDPECKEDHDKSKGDVPKVKTTASGAAKYTSKGTVGSSAANAQRSMPRKAQ